ncbi:hypothetical protein D3C81_1813480 [compost metagenome]
MRFIFGNRIIADVHVVIVETDPVQHNAVNSIILNYFLNDGALILLHFRVNRINEVFVAVRSCKRSLNPVDQ